MKQHPRPQGPHLSSTSFPMTKTSTSNSLRIRPTTAHAVAKAVTMLYELDVIDFQEQGAIKTALNSLAKRGTLPPEPEKRLLDLHEVAARLSIGESTLKRMLADNAIALPKVRIGGNIRFRIADVERLIDGVECE